MTLSKQGSADEQLERRVWGFVKNKQALQEMCSMECEFPNPAYKFGSRKVNEKDVIADNLWMGVEKLLKDSGPDACIREFASHTFLPYNKVPVTLKHQFNTFAGLDMKAYKPERELSFTSTKLYAMIRDDFCDNDRVDPGLTKKFLGYIGRMIQFPGEASPILVILHSGRGGCGKTMFLRLLSAMLGMDYVHTFKKAEIFFKDFNKVLEGKISVVLEELGERGKINENMEYLKAMLTAATLSVRPLYHESYEIANILHLFGFTNQGQFIRMPASERRIELIKINEQHSNDEGKWEDHWTDIAAEVKDPSVIKAAFDYFSNMDLTGFNPQIPLGTAFKRSRQNADMDLTLKHLISWSQSYVAEWRWKRETESENEEEVKLTLQESNAERKHNDAMMTQTLKIDEKILIGCYHEWALRDEMVTTKLTKTAYNEKLISYGLTHKQLMERGKRFYGFAFTITELQKILQHETKNPGFKLLLED
jgi:hypothetical protein